MMWWLLEADWPNGFGSLQTYTHTKQYCSKENEEVKIISHKCLRILQISARGKK